MRWFMSQLSLDDAASHAVRFENVSDQFMGFSLSGPKSREILSALCPGTDISNAAMPFMAARHVDVGPIPHATLTSISLPLSLPLIAKAYGCGIYQRRDRISDQFDRRDGV